ncbi:MAG TPA: class I SAM-dependent methyltransferase [Candidatus Paceibacterota bacterium]
MTRPCYDLYYKEAYRSDRNSIKGTSSETDLDRNYQNAKRFGKALARKYKKYFRPGLALDVGSSTGGILAGLKEVLPTLEIKGIEPSEAEASFANKHGIPTVRMLFEDFRDDLGGVQNILCVQSLNHLLDPAGFLRRSHEMLAPDGHIFLAVKNFRHQVRRAGAFEAGVQIDHPYMFTPETLSRLVRRAGFHILDLDIDEGKTIEEIAAQKQNGFNIHHIRLVARKGGKDESLPSKFEWLLTRLQFSRLSIKLHYLVQYSTRFSFLRK